MLCLYKHLHPSDLWNRVLLHPFRDGVVRLSVVLLGSMFYDSEAFHSTYVPPFHAARNLIAHQPVYVDFLEDLG